MHHTDALYIVYSCSAPLGLLQGVQEDCTHNTTEYGPLGDVLLPLNDIDVK